MMIMLIMMIMRVPTITLWCDLNAQESMVINVYVEVLKLMLMLIVMLTKKV